jgi:hypothetical protein
MLYYSIRSQEFCDFSNADSARSQSSLTSLGSRKYRGISIFVTLSLPVHSPIHSLYFSRRLHTPNHILNIYLAAMEAVRGVIDPVLLQEAGSGALAPTTNGVTTSSSTSPTPAPSPPRSRRFTKTEIAAWPASNYAPIRDANESRQEYETRLYVVKILASGRSSLNIPQNTCDAQGPFVRGVQQA